MRRKGKLEFRSHQIRIVEDYSPEVGNLRAEYRDVMTELYRLGLKPALLYPAQLRLNFFLATNVSLQMSNPVVWDALKAYLRG